MLKLFAATIGLVAVLTFASGASAEDYNWTGAYVGVGVSGVALNTDSTTVIPASPDPSAEYSATTIDPALDLSAGYNWLLMKKKLLLGIEGDIKFTVPPDGASQ